MIQVFIEGKNFAKGFKGEIDKFIFTNRDC